MKKWNPFSGDVGLNAGKSPGTDNLRNLFQGHLTSEDLTALRLFSNFQSMWGQRLPDRYFQPNGIPIGEEPSTGSKIYLPVETLMRHAALVGKTRSGKTTLLIQILLFLFHAVGCSLVVFDRGDLVPKLLRYFNDRLDDIILIKCSDTEYPVSINLLQLANYQTELVIGEIIRLLDHISSERLTDRMTMLLRRCLRALLFRPDSTLTDIEPFLFDGNFREQILNQVRDPELLNFWRGRYPKDEKLYRTSTEGIITRLEPITGDPATRNLLCQSETKIPFDDLVNGPRKYVLLLDLNSEGKINPEVGNVIARVIMLIIHGLALSRPLYNSKPIFMAMDEVQTYCEPFSLSEILSRGAKYKIHLISACQFVSQLGPDVWSAIDGNAAGLFSFVVGADDSAKIARSFPGMEPSEFVELPMFNLIVRVNEKEGTYCFQAKTFPPPRQTESHEAEIIENSRKRFARLRAEVEADFTRRVRLASESQAASEGKEADSGNKGATSGSKADVSPSSKGFVEKVDPII